MKTLLLLLLAMSARAGVPSVVTGARSETPSTVVIATGAARASFMPVKLVKADGTAFYDASSGASSGGGNEGQYTVTPGTGSWVVTAGTGSFTVIPGSVSLNQGMYTVTPGTGTWPVSAASLPLPSGAATGAKQDTGNTSVASIDSKTPALGQALAAASSPVVLTAAQMTTLTPPAAITGYALEATLTSLNGKATVINTGAAVIASQGGALAVTSTSTIITGTVPLPTGAATESTLSTLNGKVTAVNTGATVVASQGGALAVTSTSTVITGTVPLPTGAATETTLAALNNKVTAVNTGAGVIASQGGALAVTSTSTVITGALPALTASTNRVGGFYDTGGTIVDEVPTARAIQRTFVNASASGNTAVVAAQGSGVRIRVLAVLAVATAATTVKFQSATTDISAGFPFGANGGMVLPYNQHGWFQTTANEALNINLSVGTAVGVQILWVPAT